MARKKDGSVEVTAEKLLALAAGDRTIYHTGQLGYDRRRRRSVQQIAILVNQLAAGGFGHLTQVRRGPDDFDYIFIRSGKESGSSRMAFAGGGQS